MARRRCSIDEAHLLARCWQPVCNPARLGVVPCPDPTIPGRAAGTGGRMNTASHRFTVGSFQCFAISDGTSDYTCLLVDTGVHRVLIDTGMGRHTHHRHVRPQPGCPRHRARREERLAPAPEEYGRAGRERQREARIDLGEHLAVRLAGRGRVRRPRRSPPAGVQRSPRQTRRRSTNSYRSTRPGRDERRTDSASHPRAHR